MEQAIYKYKVVLVGCGKMGKAILEALLHSKLDIKIYVIDPNINSLDNTVNNNVSFLEGIEQLPQEFKPNVILFAVKPQIIKDVVHSYVKLVTSDVMVMSILAGISVDLFAQIYGKDKQIIRLMPNLGASFSKSTTFIYAKELFIRKSIIEDFIASFGSYVWLDDEKKMHQATAVAGSGPAYYFLFFKYFTEFLTKNGFDTQESKDIVINTCEAALLMAKEEQDFEQLMLAVTSPNGTTHAALKTFQNNNQLKDIFDKALTAATKRSKELSSQ